MKLKFPHLGKKKEKKQEETKNSVPRWHHPGTSEYRTFLRKEGVRGDFHPQNKILKLEPDKGLLSQGKNRARHIVFVVGIVLVVIIGRLF